jgi:hypothetical protein
MKYIWVLCSEPVPATPCLLLCRPRPPTFYSSAGCHCFLLCCLFGDGKLVFFCFSVQETSHPCAWKSISEKASMIVSQARLFLHAHAEPFLHPSVLCKFTMLDGFTPLPKLKLSMGGLPEGQMLAHDVCLVIPLFVFPFLLQLLLSHFLLTESRNMYPRS